MAETLGEESSPTATQLLERHVRELSTLHEIARAVTSVLDIESVLNRIVEASVYLTNAEEGFLLLVDEETDELTLRAGKGLGEKAARGMSMKVRDSIAGQVVKTGRPVRMGGFRHDEEYKVKTGYLVKSIVNVPIKSADRVVGVLAVDHSIASMRSFSDHDVALLSSLADYASIAIHNARLFAEASAKVDELEKALEGQTVAPPPTEPVPPPTAALVPPTAKPEEYALEQFVQGLRAQRDEVLQSIESAQKLARDLQIQATSAEDVATRLGLWDEELLSLLPQLESLAEVGFSTTAPPAVPAKASTTVDVGEVSPSSSIDSHLLQHLAEGTLLCDGKGVILQSNEAAARMLGKPLAELGGCELQTVIDDPRWERIVGSLRLTLAMGDGKQPAPPAPETTLFINDRVIHAKLIPLYESQTGKAPIIATFFHDISAETEGWRARDDMLTSLSHELRSPMTAIASYSDLLLGDTLGAVDSMQRRYLERIRKGIERLESVLNEFEEEPASFDRKSTPVPSHPIAEVIDQAVGAAQKLLSLDGVSIVSDVGPDLPPVQIDIEYIRLILADLLAAAGTRTGAGESVSVSTEIQSEGEQPEHLVVLVQGGSSPAGDVPPLEEDEHMRSALSLAEEVGSRIWLGRKADGGDMICFLLPIAEA